MNTLDFWDDEEIQFLNHFFEDAHQAILDKLGMTEEEYQKQCAPYLEEASAFSEIIKAKKGKKQELQNSLVANAVREEKSKGGECIHRGYYCPSLIEDIIIENCKRGKLCKENDPKATYTHYFDRDNRHIATRQQEGNIVYTEYISCGENKSLGIMFDGAEELASIAECEYDERGRILKYIFVLCNPTDDEVMEYNKELYAYSEETIIVETAKLLCGDFTTMLNTNKYRFNMEAGYLKNYTIEIYNNKDISCEPLNDRSFNVKIKRKIPM